MVSIEQIFGLVAVVFVSEIICPYAQMVVSYDTPESEEDLWVFDFMRALLRFDLTEAIAKIAAYGLATTLFLSGELAGAVIVIGVAAWNTFSLARRKLDKFYKADSAAQ